MLRHDTQAKFMEGNFVCLAGMTQGAGMKHIRILLVVAIGLVSGMADATVSPTGRHTIVGMLSMRKGEPAKLFVNPAHKGRYVIDIQNTKSVIEWMKRNEYTGLVRVVMQMLTPGSIEGAAKILKIVPVRLRRVPVYDGNLKAVPSGAG